MLIPPPRKSIKNSCRKLQGNHTGKGEAPCAGEHPGEGETPLSLGYLKGKRWPEAGFGAGNHVPLLDDQGMEALPSRAGLAAPRIKAGAGG